MHLSGEELVHRCHHVSVQTTSVVLCCACCQFSLYYCAVLVTGMQWGMYKCGGLYWGSAGSDLCITCVVAGAASLVLGLTVRGRHNSSSLYRHLVLKMELWKCRKSKHWDTNPHPTPRHPIHPTPPYPTPPQSTPPQPLFVLDNWYLSRHMNNEMTACRY